MTEEYDAMGRIDRFLIGTLILGIWALVALQMTSIGHAHETSAIEQETQNEVIEALIYSANGYNTDHQINLHGDYLDASTNARR